MPGGQDLRTFVYISVRKSRSSVPRWSLRCPCRSERSSRQVHFLGRWLRRSPHSRAALAPTGDHAKPAV